MNKAPKIPLLAAIDLVVQKIGRARLMEITGKRSNNITNWLSAGTFPPETYVVITTELALLGFRAPLSMWRMIEPQKKRAA